MVGWGGGVSPWESLCNFCLELGNYTLSYQRALFPYFVLHDHVHAGNVAKLARELSELVRATTPAHYALLKCAAFLHDCGMALPPRVINELKLTESQIRRDSPKTLEELRVKLGESYAHYFRDGVLTISPKMPLSYLDAYVSRKLHPWTSALYVEKYLPILLKDADLKPLTVSEVVKPLALLAKWHNSCIEPVDYACNVGGYEVRLKPLAEVLRLADAADFSRKRGRFIYEHIADDCRSDHPSVLKHWIFKMAIEDVQLSLRRGAFLIKLEGGGTHEEAWAKLAGILFFEVAANFLHDYEHFSGNLGTQLRIIASHEGREVDLTGRLNDVRKSSECLKELKLEVIAEEAGSAGSYSSQLLRDLKNEVGTLEPGRKEALQTSRVSRLAKEFDIFDAIAHALHDKEIAVLAHLQELISRKCPIALRLLKLFQT
jgi:hypothetical protein